VDQASILPLQCLTCLASLERNSSARESVTVFLDGSFRGIEVHRVASVHNQRSGTIDGVSSRIGAKTRAAGSGVPHELCATWRHVFQLSLVERRPVSRSCQVPGQNSGIRLSRCEWLRIVVCARHIQKNRVKAGISMDRVENRGLHSRQARATNLISGGLRRSGILPLQCQRIFW